MPIENVYKDNLCLIKTNKYKNINVYFNFAIEYDLKTKLILNLLNHFIGEYTNKYPNKEKMTEIKDMLYGATINIQNKVKANLILFSIKEKNSPDTKFWHKLLEECLHFSLCSNVNSHMIIISKLILSMQSYIEFWIIQNFCRLFFNKE